MATIILGGGCFWCTEAVFKRVKGVVKVMPGYAGGSTKNPSYEEVSAGKTGHAEVILVEYDPNVVSLERLLDIFFMAHDSTTKDRQGNDVGTQYRSIILYESEGENKKIKNYMKTLKVKAVTEVKKLDKFYPAEDYHKDYYEKNRNAPYCRLVILPKLEKMKDGIRYLSTPN